MTIKHLRSALVLFIILTLCLSMSTAYASMLPDETTTVSEIQSEMPEPDETDNDKPCVLDEANEEITPELPSALSESESAEQDETLTEELTPDGSESELITEISGNKETLPTDKERFSVTLPARLSLTVTDDGRVYSADRAEISNNSAADIDITSVSVATLNDWKLAPYYSDMSCVKVDAKLIGFYINGAVTTVTDAYEEDLVLFAPWRIAQGTSLTLDYTVNISPFTIAIMDETVLSVMFVAKWAE